MLDGTVRPLGNITYNNSIGTVELQRAVGDFFASALRGGLGVQHDLTPIEVRWIKTREVR